VPRTPRKRDPRIDVSKPGYPREIRKHRAPVRSCGLWVFPRQLAKAASVPLELDPPSSRTFRCAQPTSQRCVWPTSAIHMSKTSTREQFRVVSGFVIEGAPDLTGGQCLHTATARFGLCSAALARVFFPLGHATKPGPLMSPSPTALHRARRPAPPESAEIASTAAQCDGLRLSRPGTPSIHRGALLGPFPALR
jgi:hypothetical protein